MIFTPEELKALEEKGTQFDRYQGVHPAGHGRSHLPREGLLPRPRQGRGPPLPPACRGAGRRPGRAALGQYAARGKQNLVLIRPLGRRTGDGAAALCRRAAVHRKEVPLGEGEVKPAELKLAVQIVEQGATDEFKPEKYEDTVRQAGAGGDPAQGRGRPGDHRRAGAAKSGAKILDLMEALKASLAKGGPRRRRRRAKPERPASGKRPGGADARSWPAPAAGRSRSGRARSTRRSCRTTACSGYYAGEIPHRRDQQHVLPDAEGERAARLGREGAAGVPLCDQGLAADHPPRAAQGTRSRIRWRTSPGSPATLGERRGPTLFQLPPNLKKDVPRLTDFLELLPRRLAVRVRVPARELVRRRRLRRAAGQGRGALHRGPRRLRDAGGRERRAGATPGCTG